MNLNHARNAKQVGETRSVCPVCKSEYSSPPAISRKDNKTKICPQCGLKEALADFKKSMEKDK